MNRRWRRTWRLRRWITLDHEDGAWIATVGIWQYEAWAVWTENPEDSGFTRSCGSTLLMGRVTLTMRGQA